MYWMWVIIIVVAILTKFILDFQKNQMEMSKSHQNTGNKVEELQEALNRLTKRIENLEAIAAAEPTEFTESNIEEEPSSTPVMDDEKEMNQEIVNKLAQKRRTRS